MMLSWFATRGVGCAQNPFYLRRAKKIRSIKKRHTIMSCYGWVATVVEGAANVACFFGTYLLSQSSPNNPLRHIHTTSRRETAHWH